VDDLNPNRIRDKTEEVPQYNETTRKLRGYISQSDHQELKKMQTLMYGEINLKRFK